jgi:hypothetical protein
MANDPPNDELTGTDGRSHASLWARQTSTSPGFQMLAICVSNVVIALGALTLLGFGYKGGGPTLTPWFNIFEFLLVAIAGVLANYEFRNPFGTTLISGQLSEGAESWLESGPRVVRGAFIYVLACGTVATVVILVTSTGGGIDSPFTPLLAALAVYGPFITRNRVSIGLQVISVGLVIFYLDHRAAGHNLAPAAYDQRDGKYHAYPTGSLRIGGRIHEPKWWLFAAVATLVVGIAALISAGKISPTINRPVLDPSADATAAAIESA